MRIMNIPLKDLSVNPRNDRHGELVSDAEAIEWLLTQRAMHMRNLAKDIVGEGQIYEPPLVHQDNGNFTVYDGNRRVTCLKLLDKPQHAPSSDWRKFFQDLREEWTQNFPVKIACQVEIDRDRIDEILYRRHTGGQSGVGQSQWDAEAKSNFVKRTGKKTRVNVAEEIENKLKEGGYLGKRVKVPRSNLNRLLSAESFRNRVGISLRKNHIEFTHDEAQVIEALVRIANDLASKTIALDDIWSNQHKKAYLDRLEIEGALPSAGQSLKKPKNFKTSKTVSDAIDAKTKAGAAERPKIRKTLIRQDIDYGLSPQVHTQRIMDVWTELQYRLRFGQHDNAIAVLFRVILEFAIENYIARKSVSGTHTGDKLAKKFRKALDQMLTAGIIDRKYHEALRKFQTAEPILSINTMNKYVHSKNFFPSDHHLKSMWDTLLDFILVCIRA